MRKIIISIAAVGVLVTGAFVASTIADGPASAQTGDAAETELHRGEPGGILEEVLDGLVEDGTLTQAQADAVKEAMLERREEIREEREERREERREIREMIAEFLEDDVIDAGELAQLPEDHILRDEEGPFADALEDGEITRAEIREVRIRRHIREHRG